MGITEKTASSFVRGCDLIIDEIEILELATGILLHQEARKEGVPVFSCNTAGFGTHLFKFTPTSMTIEEMLGLTLSEAQTTDAARRATSTTPFEMERFIRRLIALIAPELEPCHPVEFPRIIKRLVNEQKASILGTNPAFATGFLGDHILLELLNSSPIPPMPGYAYLDARRVEAKIVTGAWWH